MGGPGEGGGLGVGEGGSGGGRGGMVGVVGWGGVHAEHSSHTMCDEENLGCEGRGTQWKDQKLYPAAEPGPL